MNARTLIALLLLTLGTWSSALAAPEGQLTTAVHVSMAPTWFDPAETVGIITPFLFLYAMHDALVKSMPGNATAPSLAESWTVSPDSLAYEFVLRKGVRFHNGDPVTPEDVKFSSSATGAPAPGLSRRGSPASTSSIRSASASASSSPGPTS
jgi:peptide/nickel transport system substrate-binding protein